MITKELYTLITIFRFASVIATTDTETMYMARIVTAVALSASSVRIDTLTAPVARFATINTGNIFIFTAVRICDGCGRELPEHAVRKVVQVRDFEVGEAS